MKRQLIAPENNIQKRQRVNGVITTEKYTQILSSLSSLSNSIYEFTQNRMSKNDVDILNKLNICRDKIPTIVTWGAQSSGKSALLNKIFPGLNLISCDGIGTRCPIIIQGDPSYESQIIVKNTFNHRETIVNNIEEAEKLVIELTKDSPIQCHGKIICKAKYPTCITIVDLPGFSTEIPDYDKYFTLLKKEYLMKPETVILHVVKGNDDPGPDMSATYLPTNNKIIKILTHTDTWVHDPSKINYFYQYDNKFNCTLAIVSNKKDSNNEMEIVDSFVLNNVKNELIRGSSNLMQIISREHNTNIHNFIPGFANCLGEAKKLIEQKLNIIGYQKPDMRQIVSEFRVFMLDVIKKEFSDGSSLAINLNILKEQFTVDQIRSYCQYIPDCDILAVELEKGTMNQIAGTEGWNDIVRKWIKILTEKVVIQRVVAYIEQYHEILKGCTVFVLGQTYKPCTESVSEKIIKDIEVEHNTLFDSVYDQIQNRMMDMSEQPYNSDDNYVKDYLINSHIQPTELLLKYIIKQKNVIQSINEALADIPRILEIVMKTSEYNIYSAKAKNAHDLLTTFWKSSSVYVHDTIMHEINSYRKKFQLLLEKHVQHISCDDLIEPEHIEIERNALLNIIKKIEEIEFLFV